MGCSAAGIQMICALLSCYHCGRAYCLPIRVSPCYTSLYSPSLHLIISVHSGLLFTNDVQVHGLLEFSPCGFYLLLSFFGSFDFSQSYFLSFLDFDIQNLRKQYYRFIGLPLSLLLFGKAQRPLTSS